MESCPAKVSREMDPLAIRPKETRSLKASLASARVCFFRNSSDMENLR